MAGGACKARTDSPGNTAFTYSARNASLARLTAGKAAVFAIASKLNWEARHTVPKSFNYYLVALSVLVAVFVSNTALSLFSRMARDGERNGRLWLYGGAGALGFGVWATHFLGMLALSTPVRLTYDFESTLGSLAVAVLASLAALGVASRTRVSTRRLVTSAMLLGGGIAAMHYMGMAAIRIVPAITYDVLWVLASIAIAVSGSFLALRCVFRPRGSLGLRTVKRGMAACVLGASIGGMHYTGMFACHFGPGSISVGGVGADDRWIAILVATLAAGLMLIVTILLAYDGYLSARTHEYNEQLENANERLQHAATHDSLTGLPNRAVLMCKLDELVQQPDEHARGFAVLLIDLDRFKEINDSLGHQAGDQLLKILGERIASQTRSRDLVARLGGDEFVVLAEGLASPADAGLLAGRLLNVIAEPVRLCGIDVHAGASIGIAVGPEREADSAAYLRLADAAMYHIKNKGRGSFQFFSSEVMTPSRERLELEDGLRKALASGEFLLHYQPKVDLRTSRIEGAEALIRWQHPERGLVSPASFIPLAEETGLIVPIGDWALQEACSQIMAWQRGEVGRVRVAVNVSAKQFQRRDFADRVAKIVRESAVDPSLLELELTESAVMADPATSISALRRLTALGVSIALDDFGTGYSSLSYLRRLPLNKLKIDRSFVQELGADDGSSEQIVRAIVSLAHNLNLKVIAEGVETIAQLRFLRAAGCDKFQGFYFSRPIAAAQLAALLLHPRADSPSVEPPTEYAARTEPARV